MVQLGASGPCARSSTKWSGACRQEPCEFFCCGEGAAICCQVWLLPVAASTSTVCIAGSSDLPSAVWASQKHFCFGSWSLPTEQIFFNTTRPHASGRHRPPLVGSWDAWVWCSLEHQAHALEAAPSGVVHVAKSLVNFSAVEKVHCQVWLLPVATSTTST